MKIIKVVASTVQMRFLGANVPKIAFAAGAVPWTLLGSAPPDFPAGFKGPTSRGRERKGSYCYCFSPTSSPG